MLDREVYPTAEFKAQSKYFVFVKINGDVQTGLKSQFGVTGYPTIKYIKPDGTQVHEVVGYEPLPRFLADMETAKRNAGIGK